MESSESGSTLIRHPESGKGIEGLTAENESLREQIEHLKKQLENRDEKIKYLEEQAFIDPLTGASNRRAFESELEQSLKLIRGEVKEHRAGAELLTEISLIMVDINHFKQVNDTLGHPAGDDVLRKVSALLMDSVRETDMVVRYGGEKFMVFLRGVDQSFSAQKAEEFREKVEKMTFDAYPDLKITASFGVVSSENSTDATVLKKSADDALYKAKETGRNRVEVYTESEE